MNTGLSALNITKDGETGREGGVKGMMERQFITAKEVAEIMGVSEGKAYSVIRELNEELKTKGYITISGKVSRVFFQEKVYGIKVG